VSATASSHRNGRRSPTYQREKHPRGGRAVGVRVRLGPNLFMQQHALLLRPFLPYCIYRRRPWRQKAGAKNCLVTPYTRCILSSYNVKILFATLELRLRLSTAQASKKCAEKVGRSLTKVYVSSLSRPTFAFRAVPYRPNFTPNAGINYR
jgi:hypothetical protein